MNFFLVFSERYIFHTYLYVCQKKKKKYLRLVQNISHLIEKVAKLIPPYCENKQRNCTVHPHTRSFVNICTSSQWAVSSGQPICQLINANLSFARRRTFDP